MNLFRRVTISGLVLSSIAVQAESLPTRLFYKDLNQEKIQLNEPASGCVMSGVLVHPIERPTAKVIWFNERICGKTITPVSYVSDEINLPGNTIHKGEKIDISPAQVTIMKPYSV